MTVGELIEQLKVFDQSLSVEVVGREEHRFSSNAYDVYRYGERNPVGAYGDYVVVAGVTRTKP